MPSERSADYVDGVVYGLLLARYLAESTRSYAAVAKISEAITVARRAGLEAAIAKFGPEKGRPEGPPGASR